MSTRGPWDGRFGKEPARLENLGDTCFLNALVQSLASSPGLVPAVLQVSDNELDQLVLQVLHGGVPQNGGHSRCTSLSTGMVKRMFHRSMGEQGPQDPCSFFIDACALPGHISGLFNATVVEMLRCAQCNAVLGTTQRLTPNHVMMLYYDSSSSARKKILDLYYDNIVSGVIDGYRPKAHHTPSSGSPCANTLGAKKVRYYEGMLPQLLCLALPSRISSQYDRAHQSLRIQKNSRTIVLEAHIFLPEIHKSHTGGQDDIRSVKYDLFSTIVHQGSDPQHGHYTAYIRIRQQWFHAVCLAPCHFFPARGAPPAGPHGKSARGAPPAGLQSWTTIKKTEFSAQHEFLKPIYLCVYRVTILKYLGVQEKC